MVAGKARPARTMMSYVVEDRRDNRLLHALLRDAKINPAGGTSSRAIGTASNVSPISDDSLKVSGGTMVGPIAFFSQVFLISSNESDTLRIDENFGAYTTRVLVTGEAAAADNIEFIIGKDDGLGNLGKAAFDGQLLIIDATLTTPLTLIDGADISLPGGINVIIPGGENAMLIYDSTQDKWNLISVSNAATAGGPFLALSGGVMAGTIDMNGVNKILLSVDGLTTIGGAGTDDVILFELGAASNVVFGAASIDIDDKIFIMSEVSTPSNALIDSGRLYVKEVGGTHADLFYKDELGTETNLIARTDHATIELDNLGVVAINASLDPAVADDGDLDLGAALASWNDLNIDRIIFRHNNGISSTNASIGMSSLALRLNTPVNEELTLEVAGIDQFKIAADKVTIGKAGVGLTSGLVWDSSGGSPLSIIKTGSAPALFSCSDGYKFTLGDVQFGNTAGLSIIISAEGNADFNANEIVDIGNMTMALDGDLLNARNIEGKSFRFTTDPTVVKMDLSSTGFVFDVAATGDTFSFDFGGLPKLTLTDSAFTIGPSGNVALLVNASMSLTHVTDAYYELSDIVDPPSPTSGFGRIFLDSADDILKIIHSDASVVSLEGAGGGIAFPIEHIITDNGDGWSNPQTLNLATGDGHTYKWTVDQDLTFAATVTNRPASGTQRTFELEFVHDGVGGTFTVTLPNNFVDDSGVTLVSFTIANGDTVLLTARINDNTTFLVVQKNVAAVGGGGGLDNIVEDTTPQLGGMLDVNGFALGDGTLELLKFEEVPSAVNEIKIRNAATGNAPLISVGSSGDANVDLELAGKGTGTVAIIGSDLDIPSTQNILLSTDNLTKISGAGTNDIILFQLGASSNITFADVSINIEDKILIFEEISTPGSALANSGRLYVKEVGGTHAELFYKDELGTETNIIAGGGSTSFADDVFDVHDNVTPTKIFQFNLAGMAVGTTTFNIDNSSPRIYTFPNTTATLAHIGTSTQVFAGVTTFTAGVFFNNNVDLGSDPSDKIDFNGVAGTDLDMVSFDLKGVGDLILQDGQSIGSSATSLNIVQDVENDDINFIFGAKTSWVWKLDALRAELSDRQFSLQWYRNDATPNDGDTVMAYSMFGKDSAGNKELYVSMGFAMTDVTSLSEDGRWLVSVTSDGDENYLALHMEGSAGSVFGGGMLAFRNQTAVVAQTYTVTNQITDRGYNANAATVDELADVLATLLQDLDDMGIVELT